MNIKDKINYSKAYIITKDKDENNLIEPREYFERADKYLTINPKISIGIISPNRKHSNYNSESNNKKRNSELFNLILSSRKCTVKQKSKIIIKNRITKTEETTQRKLSIFSFKEKSIKNNEKINNTKKINVIERNELNKKNHLTIEPKKNKNNIHYQYRTFNDLKKLFKQSIEREKHFKLKGTNSLIPLSVDNNIKEKFFSQEKKLKFNQTSKSNEEKYIKYLAEKCKKAEKELLINCIEDFRMKQQLKEYIENNKILSERFGNNYWLFNLRRSDKNDFIRLNYVNVGNSKREIWKTFIDYPDKDFEFINDPYNKIKNKIPIFINFNKKNNKVKKLPDIKSINEIKIEGKNLVKKEFKDIIEASESKKNKCKFKVYKDPRENNKNNMNNFTCRELYEFKKIKIKDNQNKKNQK